MTTTDEHRQAIARKLPDLKCPLCGDGRIGISERCFTSFEVDSSTGEILPQGRSLPMVIASCRNCGHSLHFHQKFLLE